MTETQIDGVSVGRARQTSLADSLSAIAIDMAETTDLSGLFDLLGREFHSLNLGLALALPALGRPESHSREAKAEFLIHYLCDSPLPEAGAPSSDGSDPDVSTENVELNNLRHPRFFPAFAQVAEQILPRALVAQGDAGVLLPLSQKESFAGVMGVWGELGPKDLTPLAAFSGMLGLCLRIIRQAIIQQTTYHSEQGMLLDLSRILLQGREIPVLLNQVAEIIFQLDGTSPSTIYLYDADSTQMVPTGAWGWDGGSALPIARDADGGYINGVSYVYFRGVPVIIDDETTEVRFGKPQLVNDLGIRSVIIVPMHSGQGDVIGAISNLSQQSYSMDEQRVRLLSLIASNTAQAVQRLQLFQETRRQLDELAILHEVSRLIAEIQEEDPLIQAITDLIGGVLFPVNFGFVIYREDLDGLVVHPSYRSAAKNDPAFDPNTPEIIPMDFSICGEVYRTGKAVRVADVRTAQRVYPAAGGLLSEMCVPLLAGNDMLGVINAEDHKVDRFSQADENLLSTLASQVAVAIQRMRLFDAERKRRQRTESLRIATASLASTLDMNDVLANILRQLKTLIQLDSACIFLHNEWGLLAVAATGFENLDEIVGRYFSAERALYREIYATGRPIIIEDTHQDKRYSGWANTGHIRGWLGVPMKIRNRIIGYITIDSHRPRAFSSVDAEQAVPFANQAAMVIENARLFEAERRQLLVAQMQQEAAALLTAQTGTEQVLERILAYLGRVVPHDSSSIMLLDEGGAAHLVASHNLFLPPQVADDFAQHKVQDILKKFEESDVAIIGDTETDSRWIHIEGSPIRSWVGALLKIQGKPIGLLNIDSCKAFSFDQSIEPMVRAFANQAGMAIYNARMFEQTQQALHRTEVLYDSIQTMIGGEDLPTVVQVVAEQSRAALSAHNAVFHLFDLAQGRMLYRTTSPSDERILGVVEATQAKQMFQELWSGVDGLCLAGQRPMLFGADGRPVDLERPQSSIQTGRTIRIPLVGQGAAFGLITVESRADGPDFTLADLEVLSVIAHQATIVIQNLRLFTTLEAEKNRLGILYSLSRNLAASLELSTVLERVLDEMLAHLGGYRGFVLLADPNTERLHLVAISGLTEDQIIEIDQDIQLSVGQGLAGQAAVVGRTIVVSDVLQDERWMSVPQLDGDARSAIAIPLFTGLTLIGVINLVSTIPGYYDQQNQSLFNAISVPVALAIQNAQYYEGLQHRADELRASRDILRSLNTATHLADAYDELIFSLQAFTGCAHVLFYDLNLEGEYLTPSDTVPGEDEVGQLFPGKIPLAEIGLDSEGDGGGINGELGESAQGSAPSFGARTSVQGRALLNGKVTYVADMRRRGSVERDLTPANQRFLDLSMRSYLFLPLQVAGHIPGAIQLGWDKPDGFDQAQLSALRQISDAIAMLMEKSRLLTESTQRAAQLSALYEFSAALRRVDRTQEVLAQSVKLAATYLQAHQGIVVVPETVSIAGETTDRLVIAHTHGAADLFKDLSFALDRSLAGKSLQTGQAFLISFRDLLLGAGGDVPAGVSDAGHAFLSDERFRPLGQPLLAWLQAHPDETMMMVSPIRTEQGDIGAMMFGADVPRGPFVESDLRLLTAMSEIIGSSMERAGVLETLEQRVNDRTRELAAANEQLKQLDRLKSEFVSNISHELRTPLTNIKLYLHLLSRRQAEGQQPYLETLNQETAHLQHLIETILDLSHLDAGMIGDAEDFSRVSLNEVIYNAVDNNMTRAQEREIELEALFPDSLISIRGDQTLLTQMLDKLITNAINYSFPGDQVQVALARREQQILIEVTDTGMGISPMDRDHIFERFFRSTRSTDANIPGTGLGLSIVQEIARLHSARINVISEIDHGSTFQIWFPNS